VRAACAPGALHGARGLRCAGFAPRRARNECGRRFAPLNFFRGAPMTGAMSAAATPRAYRQSAVLSASPCELVVMQYDGARRFLRQAAIAMEAGEVERAHNKLRRAETIIAHLDGSLDYKQGELPQQLHAIYSFCLVHLNSARMEQDAGKLAEVSELLGELREAWAQLALEVDA